MTQGILHADEINGWRGTIHDGQVVDSHDDAVAREEKQDDQPGRILAGGVPPGRRRPG
jgi:hypothetical protein